MNNYEDETYYEFKAVNPNYIKCKNSSSGGISGGAVAAIVIACAAAVIGISMFVILFRKPIPPPNDKTNISKVELQSDDKL